MALFIMVYKVASTVQSRSIKAMEQYFPVVLFIEVLYKMDKSFTSVCEILKCHHSNMGFKQYFPVVLLIHRLSS